MIDPVKVTNFQRSSSELEELLLFCIAVAGKNATRTSVMLEQLLEYGRDYCQSTPFEIIKKLNEVENLPHLMKNFGFGCYTHKSKGFIEAAYSGLNLAECTAEQLEKIHGVGMKTSRYFLLHSRKNARVACLDTHVLKWLARHSGLKVPKQSPTKNKYRELEQVFLKVSEALQIDPADLDLKIWNMSRGTDEESLAKSLSIQEQ